MLKETLASIDFTSYIGLSPWQIGCGLVSFFTIFTLLLMLYPVLKSFNKRDKIINYTLMTLFCIGTAAVSVGAKNYFEPKTCLLIGAFCCTPPLFLFSLTLPPVGSKWWIYLALPIFEVLFLVMLIVLSVGTALSTYVLIFPTLVQSHPDLQDEVFGVFQNYKAIILEVEFCLILLGVIIHFTRKQLLLIASPQVVDTASQLSTKTESGNNNQYSLFKTGNI